MKTKIIFLALVLITGLGCFGQDQNNENLTLRDEDLPYEISDSDSPHFSQSSEYNEYPVDNVSSQSSEYPAELSNTTYINYAEDQNSQNSTMYTGKVYWIDTRNRVVYSYDTIVDIPNAKFFYYGSGYNFTYYPNACPIIYDVWYSWRLFRYSSYYSFCHAYPFFHRGVNPYCNSLSFGYSNYGRPMYLRNNYYGRRYTSGNYDSRRNSYHGNNRYGNSSNNSYYDNNRYGSGGNNNRYGNNRYGSGGNNSRMQSQSRVQTQQRSPQVQSQRIQQYQQRVQSQSRMQTQRSSSPSYSAPSRSGNSYGASRPSSNGGYNHQRR